MRTWVVCLFVVLIFGVTASAQNPPADKAKRNKNGDSAAANEKAGPGGPKEDKSPQPAPVAGDTITLKSGTVVRGKLLRTTPLDYEVEVSKGVETLKIPRKQVEKVVLEQKPAPNNPPNADQAQLIPGDKIKPEIYQKLVAPFPAPVKYDKADFVTVLGELAKKAEVPLTIDDPVKALEPATRTWTLEAKAGTNLMTLLQQDFLAAFKNVGVVYQFDKVLVTTKDKAATMDGNAAPPVAPPPPSPEAPAAK